MTNEQAVDEVMAQVAALSPEDAAIIKDPEAWLNAKFDALRERAEKAEAEAARLRTAIATHKQEQREAVTKSAADAADNRLWRLA